MARNRQAERDLVQETIEALKLYVVKLVRAHADPGSLLLHADAEQARGELQKLLEKLLLPWSTD